MLKPFYPQRIAVCVPVRNEEALLPALLDALAGQQGIGRLSVALCFLLDGCHDGSAGIVADFRNSSPLAVLAEAPCAEVLPNAGRARRRAMALGQAWLAGDEQGALLSTDADSVPAQDWIEACCRSLTDCDVVAGRIIRDGARGGGVQDLLEGYLDRLYALRRHIDPVTWETWPVHHHIGGANLAFRATAYRDLGGFADLPSGEDAAIVDAAHRLGLRVRRDGTVMVQTSARHHGRAANGLADHLRALSNGGGQARVACPRDAVWQYRGHAVARASYPHLSDKTVLTRLAATLSVDLGHIDRIAATTPNVEAFVTHVVPAAPGGGGLIPLDEAEQRLAALERTSYERAA